MLRLSKRVEYGLMALQHLAKCSGSATSREIADAREIPYDLLAKVMQSLKRDGLIDSYQGVKGGYALMMSPNAIPLSRVIHALEDETAIVDCAVPGANSESCAKFDCCSLKDPLHKLQRKMDETLASVTVAELL